MRFIVLIYALLVMGGGIFGYAKTASPASLIAGLSFGVILLIGAAGMFRKRPWGGYTALAATFVLDGFFTLRFLKTLTFFPAGFFSLLSLAMLIFLAIHLSRK